jgi:hypothetical protein
MGSAPQSRSYALHHGIRILKRSRKIAENVFVEITPVVRVAFPTELIRTTSCPANSAMRVRAGAKERLSAQGDPVVSTLPLAPAKTRDRRFDRRA